MRTSLALIAVLLPLASATAEPPATRPAIAWQSWTPDLFDRARREHRFVLLDLEAVWCHWCHVMDETTYADADVVRLIGQKYIAVRVDQDSRPDLANRYEDYGWPATIVFAPDGSEIVKRRGYLRPGEMASMLQAIIDDPTPGPSVRPEEPLRPADGPRLAAAQREDLVRRLRATYDPVQAGWGDVHKFVDADVIEFCLASHDAELARSARATLTAARKLIDPAWGGVYQYSTDGDWDHPHFEKIMSYQADDLRTYARASVALREPGFLAAAQQIHRYLRDFLTDPATGAFYTSQDADLVPGEHAGEYFALGDGARRARGIPRVDRHVYARENGWAIEALTVLAGVEGDDGGRTLAEAQRAADWIVAHRALAGGGFRHGDADDDGGPFLGDTLAMGRAALALHAGTADRAWLTRATHAARFIDRHFARADAGFGTAAASPAAPLPQIDENVSVVRFANLLHAYTADPAFRAMAERGMRFLAAPQTLARRRWEVGGLLLADRELDREPLHVVIVGGRDDPAARALFHAAQGWPTGYARIEWYDPAIGPLPRMDVEYPRLARAAAFFCTGGACSSPMFEAGKLREKRDAAVDH
jgi:uncharacterized protein YyaL (SSP411 family)